MFSSFTVSKKIFLWNFILLWFHCVVMLQCYVLFSLQWHSTLLCLYHWACSVLSHYMHCTVEFAVCCCTVLICHFFRFQQQISLAFTTAISDQLSNWIQKIMLCVLKVLRTVIAQGVVDIRVLDRYVVTTVVVADVDWFILRMEVADFSDTSVSVTQLRVCMSQMTLMWRVKGLCLLLSE